MERTNNMQGIKIRIAKTPHNTINIWTIIGIPMELKNFFGALDVWAYNPNGRDSYGPYRLYEVDESLKKYLKSDAFKGMLARFGVKANKIVIEL